jgi:DNA repair protein RecO (recombination protein O)
MALVHDRCICLFKTEFSETSQILSLFSRAHGIVRVIAKGAHRRTKAGASRFDGGVDLLELGDAVFTLDPQKDLSTLTEWHLAEGHPGLRLGSSRREEASLAFVLELLREAGYLPELLACVSCGSTGNGWMRAWFSPARSGILCANCESSFPDRNELDARLLRLAQMIVRMPQNSAQTPRLPLLTRHQTDPLNRMLADHVEHTLGRPLRMRRYIV